MSMEKYFLKLKQLISKIRLGGLITPFSFIIITIILVSSISNCTFIAMQITGMKKIKHITDKDILNTAVKFQIENYPVYKINDTLYLKNILLLDDTLLQQNLLQPLQLIYYKNDSVIFHLVNCFITGFPNLNWEKSINQYINSQIPNQIKTPFSLNDYYTMIISLHNSINNTSVKHNRNTIIVFYNSFMNKQSNILINTILNYDKNGEFANSQKIFINTDNLYTSTYFD